MQQALQIMGILNITPDSFYDGNQLSAHSRSSGPSLTGQSSALTFHVDKNLALHRLQKMVEEGVGIIDIGGQSALETAPISEKEELLRVLPIVDLVRSHYPQLQISVDTSKAVVAAQALKSGVHIINDITAGRGDLDMLKTVAKSDCLYVIMYNKDTTSPARIRQLDYEDVVKTLYTFFEECIQAAQKAGIERSRLIIDPGLGHFISSDGQYSWEVLERLSEFKDLGCPILVSPSRKSFTAKHPHQPPSERLPGTLKATKMALKNGASIVRTHDVGETAELSLKLKN